MIDKSRPEMPQYQGFHLPSDSSKEADFMERVQNCRGFRRTTAVKHDCSDNVQRIFCLANHIVRGIFDHDVLRTDSRRMKLSPIPGQVSSAFLMLASHPLDEGKCNACFCSSACCYRVRLRSPEEAAEQEVQ